MFFFVQNNTPIREITEILRLLNCNVRENGIARPEEIVFFYNKDQEKGFRCNAHKFSEKDVPDFAILSPFLVSVGPRWSPKGLVSILKSYKIFFMRGIPVFDMSMTDEQIINICRNCLVLPWGGFPQTDEGEKMLVAWIRKAYPVFFSHERENTNRLTVI